MLLPEACTYTADAGEFGATITVAADTGGRAGAAEVWAPPDTAPMTPFSEPWLEMMQDVKARQPQGEGRDLQEPRIQLWSTFPGHSTGRAAR